jgi:hypothetical protein
MRRVIWPPPVPSPAHRLTVDMAQVYTMPAAMTATEPVNEE